jgi:hypothetical protein
MVSALIHMVVVLLVVGVIWWGVTQILPLIPLPDPIARVVHVLLVVVLVIVVIYALMGLIGAAPTLRLG